MEGGGDACVEFREWNACQNMRKDELKDAIE